MMAPAIGKSLNTDKYYRCYISFKQKMKKQLSLLFLLILMIHTVMAQSKKPLRMGIAGITHSHVHGLLGRPNRGDVQIVGIVEPNKDLAQRYSDRYGYSMNIVFNTMAEMISKTKPEIVSAFGSISSTLK